MATITLPAVTVCPSERDIAAEAMAAADRLLAEVAAKGVRVQPVFNYRVEVESIDEGRAFLRAGVDGGQCKTMSIVAVDTGTGHRLFVVDPEGGRNVVRMCGYEGWAWAEVEAYTR